MEYWNERNTRSGLIQRAHGLEEKRTHCTLLKRSARRRRALEPASPKGVLLSVHWAVGTGDHRSSEVPVWTY